MTSSKNTCEIEKIALVNKYATPLAIIMVVMGLFLSQPLTAVRNIIIYLLLFSIVFNLAAVRTIKRWITYAEIIIKLRLIINLLINIALVYYMGVYWLPIWLLLALTPIATAIYSSRAKTLLSSIGVSIILLLIQSTRRLNDLMDWGQQLSYACFIILISLMVNELSGMTKSTSS